ncbi:MAG TPA: hypothetical protein VFI23_06290 [Rhizomicrobium sp.]|nr:hypothetical protein [Rhizomicrobium sp.]
MKKAIIFGGALALCAAWTLGNASPSYDEVSSKVRRIAAEAGADTAALNQGLPIVAALRSQIGIRTKHSADLVLAIAEEGAASATSKWVTGCSLDNCPHAGTLSDARADLSGLKSKSGAVAVRAAKLHHAAASVRKARKGSADFRVPANTALHGVREQSQEDAKLALAGELADRTADLLESGR